MTRRSVSVRPGSYRRWIKNGSALDLKLALVRAGVRQTDVARHMRVSESTVSRIVTGRRQATEEEFEAIVAYVAAQEEP